MPLFLKVEDVFSVYPDVFVHPVNCIGVSKDLLSRQVKKTWPDYFREYTRSCIRKKIQPAHPTWHEVGELFGTRFVVALPLKVHWQEKMSPHLVKEAFERFFDVFCVRQLRSVAIPIFDGPPPGWIEREVTRLAQSRLDSTLETVYLFDMLAV